MNKSHKKRKSRDKRHYKRENSVASSIIDEAENTTDKENEETNTFVIKTSKIMGRYVVASRNLKPGSIILKEEPLAVGPCSGGKILCLGCYYNIEKDHNSVTYKCEECGWPICNSNCAGLHQEYGHSREECAVLKKTNSSKTFVYTDLDTIRCHYNTIVPLRCLLLKTVNPLKYKKLINMEAHNDIRRNIPIVWKNNQVTVVDVIRKDWKLLEFGEDEIHNICGILEVNAFEIGQHGISIRGVYPSAFLMAHDCVPNTTHTDEDFHYRLTVRASTPISVHQPITLSYAYTLQSTLKRREHLLESKFFHCACKRCTDPTELGTYVGALLCPKCDTGLVLSTNPLDADAAWSCNTSCESGQTCCPGYRVSAKSMKLLMEKISEDVEAIDGSNVEGFEAFLQKYRNVLHPNHYHCLGVKHSLSQLYGKIDEYMIDKMPEYLLNRKREICTEILKIFDVLEPGYSRLRGVTLYELHAPIMILTTRDFESQNISKSDLRERLKEVVNCLKESSVILGFEPEYSVEGIMATAAVEGLVKIKDWQKILGKI